MRKRVICAGHVSLDVTPVIPDGKAKYIEDVIQPGKLLHVGPAKMSPGGSVSNTGLGMKLLGNDVSLMCKIGNDTFGDMIAEMYSRYGAADGLIRQERDSTSYTVVLAIPGIDRIFLHDPGANDTFCADDIPWDQVRSAALFHFGYPPLMASMFAGNGGELVKIMRKAQEAGAATSLDLAAVDPDSESGKADWRTILQKTLPYVDFFVPSAEELCYMLDRKRFREWKKRAAGRDVCEVITAEDIRPLARTCMDYGCRVLMIKCGAPGMYLRTASAELLKKISPKAGLNADVWADRDFFERSYKPDRILSGSGAGDASIAAFLTAVLEGDPPEWAMRYAAAEGASCVTELDAVSGLKPLPELRARIEAGWEKNQP